MNSASGTHFGSPDVLDPVDTPIPTPVTDFDHWPTATEAARILNVSRSRLDDIYDRLEPVRDARGWRRFPPDKLASYIAQREARRQKP